MSIRTSHRTEHDDAYNHADDRDGAEHPEPPELDEDLVAIRRNVLLSGAVGGLSLLLGLAYLIRGSSFFDVLLGLVLLCSAAIHLPAMVSARVPVLVADDHGIRLRIGFTWRGLPWSSIRQVVVEYADSPLREGRLVVVPRDPKVAFRNLGGIAEAHLRWNNVWYSAPLSVPLGLTTLVDSTDLAGDMAAFAAGRVEIVTLRGHELARLDDVAAGRIPVTAPAAVDLPTAEPAAPAVEEHQGVAFGPPVPEEDEDVLVLPEPVSPLRDLSTPARVDVRLEPTVPDQRAEADEGVADVTDVPAPRPDNGPDWAALGINVVIDDVAPPGAPVEPVIGPKIVHAREMLDMSIDELSQRTRIRPHVLEAMEVDDFLPCGGDFYARGHLTAVSRALGLTLDPLLKAYDEHYAQAPINARRVFEAELSTGLSSGMRATLGGPRWSLLIGSVLCLTMVWGLARIFAGDPEQLTAAPSGTSQTAGLAANTTPITSPKMRTTEMTVTAAHAATKVVVRDRTGRILWSGDLALGKHRKIVGLAPFKVSADNAGGVTVTVRGKALGAVGTAGQPGAKTFR
ncbi:MAG: RodZ domain-containing protein [Marmoricola sp.]